MKTKKNSSLWHSLTSAESLVIIGCFVLGSASLVHADQYTQQIQNLQQQNNQTQESVTQLQDQAGSYQNAINLLQSQINSVQQSIANNQNEQTTLQNQIQAENAELVQQKSVLGDDIKAMYADGQLSTIEMLASSQNLSAYVDQQAYQQAVEDKIQATLSEINQLETSQQTQQTQIAQLLKVLQSQQTQLSSEQSQQNSLLAYNQQQQTQYNQQIQNNLTQIQQLQVEEAAALKALQGNQYYGGTGSYPWASAPCPYGAAGGADCGDYDWAYPAGSNPPLGAPTGLFDPFGYEYRNCTSYVAWKIDTTSSNPIITSLISGLGNASQWPSGAQSRGIPVSYGSNPKAGDAVVVPNVAAGQGHVMYLESINSNGSINISQYNAGSPGGTYSTATIQPSEFSGLVFIQFPTS